MRPETWTQTRKCKLSPLLAEAGLTDAEASVMLGAIRNAPAGDAASDVKILQVRTAPGVVQVRSRRLANTVVNWRKCIVDLGLAASGGRRAPRWRAAAFWGGTGARANVQGDFGHAIMRLQTVGVVTRSEPDGGLIRTETIVFV